MSRASEVGLGEQTFAGSHRLEACGSLLTLCIQPPSNSWFGLAVRFGV